MNSLPLYTILPGKPLLTNSAYYLYCRVKKGKLAVLDAKSLNNRCKPEMCDQCNYYLGGHFVTSEKKAKNKCSQECVVV